MYNEENINPTLENMYLEILEQTKRKNSVEINSHISLLLTNSLIYANENYESFNKDELVVVKNILVFTENFLRFITRKYKHQTVNYIVDNDLISQIQLVRLKRTQMI